MGGLAVAMLSYYFFNGALLLATGYALWRGGAPERIGALLLLLAARATAAVDPDPATSYLSVEVYILAVDVALLVALTFLAAMANRYWPIWLAALQLLTVATHGVRAFDSRVWAHAYWLVVTHIGFLVVALLAVGTARHRQRLRAGRAERGWTWSSWTSDAAERSITKL